MSTAPSALRSAPYRRLLGAQVVALLGTGLLTVALNLLAYDIAPGSAGAVVATALTVKMVAYVGVAPAMAAIVAGLSPRVVLVGSDVVRVLVAATLPWVDQVWQVYVLIFVLQAASATFTPTYQALLPTVLPRKDDYTRALSFSRLAYDLEAVLSPLVAAVALVVVSYHGLFAGTAIGFVGSALLVLGSRQGAGAVPVEASEPFRRRLTAGVRLFAGRPRLRAVVALDLAAAGATATVLVNTVVVTRGTLGGGADSVAVALSVFGAGSMVVALALPRVLRRRSERQVMLGGAVAVTAALGAAVLVTSSPTWPTLLVVWFVLGAAGSAVLTPTGQVITSAVSDAERPTAFAAHFSLSHACYLFAYPVAGWVGRAAGVPAATAALAVVAALAATVAAMTWSSPEPSEDASLDHPARPDATRLAHGSEIFAMLGEPTRLELLWLMTEGPQTVTALVEAVDASRTSVSQHLAKLRRAGVVDVLREGRTALYSLRGGHVERLVREGLNHADHVVSGERPHA
ncbi:metalloregulator ArsR/SmtB family transcription factor [Aeromicrobium fastidiosum]|uniref:MFS transporter n=1 Tax=Aeromicrobium fastidiosum TaxID=52699 RepID=UPI0020232F2F|nr:MFS transporter [Aeromicrobium fastidiosum]MCL8250479.1 metalloregulator ArsR/SmtB family transcription factor [Aeromicrobium fastidiosum]